MDNARFELARCEQMLLEEIADKQFTRLDVAKTYALAMRSSESKLVDWGKVSAAIIARWSKSALVWIKNQAWTGKAFDEPRARRGGQ